MKKSNLYLKQLAWEETLEKTCKCYPDAVGNRPCDNGCICDKCSAEWVQDVYKSKIANL